MAQARGIRIHQYLEDWLLRAPCQATCLQHTRTLLAKGWVVNMKKSELTPQQVFNFKGLGSKHEEIETDSSTGFQFRRLPVQPVDQSGLAHSGPVVYPEAKVTIYQRPELLHSLTVHVSDRSPHSDGETSLVRPPSHEAHPVALEATLACSGGSGTGHTFAPFSSSSPRLVVEREQCTLGPAIAPLATRSASVYRRLKQRLGAHLGDSTARGIWSDPESRLHINILELRAVFLALKSFENLCRDQIVLIATDNTTVVSYINKEGGMRSGSLCALLWRLLSWCHPWGIVLRARHIPGRLNVIVDKLSRHSQVIQTEWSLSQRVFNLLCSNWDQPQVDLFATRFNHKLCVTGTGSNSLGGRRPDSAMGESGCLRVSFSFSAQPSDLQGDGSGLSQNDSNCSRVAQHALVLGPGQSISSDPLPASTSKGSGDTAFQRPPSQEPQQSESACLVPRASAIQKQGFTDEVAARIEAPHRLSTRAVHKSKWAIFVKWCDSHEVHFRSPSVSQIADFL